MKHSILLILFLCIGCAALNAQNKTNLTSSFEIYPSRNIDIEWKGEKLISGDSLSWISGSSVGSHAEVFKVTKEKGWQTTNVWNSNFILPYRREIGLSPEGKKIELTFQAHQDALMDSYPASHITYKILVPLSTVNNSTYDLLVGRSQNAQWRNGEINSSIKDEDQLNINGVRWITFNTSKGPITFDFNPHGVTTYYTGGMNTMTAQWAVSQKDDMIEISFSASASNHGGDVTGKLTIFEGDKNDYLKHHAATYYYYFSELLKEKLFSFNKKAGKDFTHAGLNKFDLKKGYGWENPKTLFLTESDSSGALYASCSSSQDNTFSTIGLRPGLYLVTVRSSALDNNVGPFDVSLNGEKLYKRLKVEKGKVANLTFVRWIDQGKADIKFEGDWAASVIGFQMFMHKEEDFQFRRGNWIKNDGFCPGVIYANYYDTPPVYGKSHTYTSLAGTVDEIDIIPELPELEVALPDQDADGLSWRFNSPLGTLGPDNWGTFNEFNTPEKIEKRLHQVKETGTNAVILNGFLSRHTYFKHLERVEENIRETVEKAHEIGMKVIDHQDLTILWNADMGFRFLAANPNFLQHSHSNGLPTWGLCPSNPNFNEYFFPYIVNLIKKTNIDGLMIDECTFHGANYCNCAYCRDEFTKTTGLLLPDNETNPLLQNKSSRLWKAWIEWRKHAIAQWRIDLSKETLKINPNFSNLQYYSEGGFLTNSASYSQGGDLPLSAKSMDFMGTEIMSRDVWDDYRYNFTSRNMYNSLRETYGSPIFGLVYANNYNHTLIGWAMNNMFGQVTWSLSSPIEEKKMTSYTGWEEDMNKVSSQPFTDIGIVFSRTTRDWSVLNTTSYPHEIMGTSQFLTERHIQHTFILDDAITGQDISRFRVLLAPGMDCISDDQEKELKQFVFNGGTLHLTGDAGKLTPYGEPRKIRAFSDILSEEDILKAANLDWVEAKHGKGKIVYTLKRNAINEYCRSFTDGIVYSFNPDPEITKINERIMNYVVGNTTFKSVSVPSKVLVSVYKNKDEEKNTTMIHLLNATGVKVKNGDILPVPNPEWGVIDEDLVFEIALPSIEDAYYATPDTPGHKSVRTEKIGNNLFKIIVPKGTVEKYGIVYLKHNNRI